MVASKLKFSVIVILHSLLFLAPNVYTFPPETCSLFENIHGRLDTHDVALQTLTTSRDHKNLDMGTICQDVLVVDNVNHEVDILDAIESINEQNLDQITSHQVKNLLPSVNEEIQQLVASPHTTSIETLAEDIQKGKQKKSLKPWTVMVYMAGDNDLSGFVARNIKQMAVIGSTNNVNIVIHLDIKIAGGQKVTRWYYIDATGQIIHLNADDPATQVMDSGDTNTLITFCTWAIKNFPADKYCLIFWNHGTGILDPERGRVINPSNLFMFNPATNKLELDRSVAFWDIIEPDGRGVCWDDSRRNFLTNQKLDFALNHICTNVVGRKIDIIGFDACLMSMLEVGNLLKPYASYMVSSQEVILGSGWNYTLAFEQFTNNAPDTESFATNIVNAYHKTYNQITNDYTLSAVDLSKLDLLEEQLSDIAKLLTEAMRLQKNNAVKAAIKTSRNRLNCTYFDEPTYIDLAHLLKNIKSSTKYFSFTDAGRVRGALIVQSLEKSINKALDCIVDAVLANTTGKNLNNAEGLSIYFPDNRIHPSYPKTNFAASNAWIHFLRTYLSLN